MNTLTQIRTLVAAHKARESAYGDSIENDEHAVVQLLDSILPLLEVAAKIELNDGKMPEFQWFSLIGNYETEVAKLLAEVAE